MNKKAIIYCVIFITTLTGIFMLRVYADEIDDITSQLSNLKRDLEASQNATKPLEKDIQRLTQQLETIKAQIQNLTLNIEKKRKEVKKGEEALVYQKSLLDSRVFEFYKNAKRAETSLLDVFSGQNLSVSMRSFFYQKTLADQNKKSIIRIVLYVKDLENKKKQLEIQTDGLKKLQAEVDKQSMFLTQEVAKAKKYQSELSIKIAQLSARQQQLINQKQASLNIPVSAGTSLKGCTDDRDINPGFSPRFAFFTYGVPNRTGMNQYGAKGRAEAGQNAEEILRAYYDNFELKKDFDTGIIINVEGIGSYNIEDYTKRIYEMPGDWPMEALKAQAIAARSYALAYTSNGARSICSTQQCQVVKAEEKGGRWNEAVDATRGWVMVQGNSPIKAWYSSTHGGYILKSSEIGWSDTSWTKHAVDSASGISSFTDLQNNAYDRSSPWFYCDWGSRSEYNKTAWLKQNEVADIVNVLMLAKRDASIGEHLYQTDKPNPAGTDTWNEERVKSELRSRGGNPFNSISNVSVNADFGSGRVSSITFSGDAGSVTFEGREFKDWFNLRAPENIQIVGQLYNVEIR